MSKRERHRLRVLERVKIVVMTLKEAASLMGVSYRQARRIRKRYVQNGAAGLAHRSRGRESNRKRSAYRQRREPKKHFGEIVPFDGSHHCWFEDRSEETSCLMSMVDDETKTTPAFLVERETIEEAMRLLWGWIERYGIPMSL